METTLLTVTIAAAITAIMTGVGALPFMFVRDVSERTIGIANAAAAGLMLAASHSLVAEGVSLNPSLALAGVLLGLGAILASDRLLERVGNFEIADLQGASAVRALLILGIMTAHSFAEGIGVGVSFAGDEGLGVFITSAIALHNVPEGLAIALVLVPRGTPVWKAALWAIFTSLPQPLMAAPAFIFVEWFRPMLPVGLGLAAGAMIWMVFSELAPDALRKSSGRTVGAVVVLAFAGMMFFQVIVLR